MSISIVGHIVEDVLNRIELLSWVCGTCEKCEECEEQEEKDDKRYCWRMIEAAIRGEAVTIDAPFI